MRKFFCALSGLLFLLSSTTYADLHDPQNAADYLILSTDSLIQHSWIDDLVAWRTAQGRSARAIAVEAIYTEFGSGTPSDSVLRDFLFYIRANWQPPQLKDVFIVGWHDVVPAHILLDSSDIHLPDSLYWVRCDYLSDLFYADDPATAIPEPVFNVGRLPWSPADTLPFPNYYSKVVGYETAGTEPWQTRVQVIADYNDGTFIFWQNFAEPLIPEIHGGYTIERDYVDEGAPTAWHSDRDNIVADLNDGSFLQFYIGHGGGGIWSGSLLLTNATMDSLTNSQRLPIVSATCFDAGLNGHYVIGRMASSLLGNPHGGAIGYFANTNLSWLFSGMMFRQRLAHQATHDSVHVMGDIWQRSLEQFIRDNYPGSFGVPNSSIQQTAFNTMLMGDPGLVLPTRLDAAPRTSVAQRHDLRIMDNYPNPFNASTNIVFELPNDGNTTLRIFDITGREVARLIDGFQSHGQHTVQWNAAAHASGTYFVALNASSRRHVRKITLLK